MSSEENALNDSMDDSPSNVPTPASQRSSGILSPTAFGSMPSSIPISLSAAVGHFLNVPNGYHPGHAASAAAQLLAIDQISLNSQSSSAYNSCPYTPLNSVADDEEDLDGEFLASRAYYADEDGSSSSCPPSRRSRASGPSSSMPTPPNTATASRHPSTSSLTASLALDVAAAAAAVASYAASRRQLGPRNTQQMDLLPSFNSRDMLERIEYKRLKMKAARGWDHVTSGETSPNVYPFTPKNSFVDSSFEEAYRNRQQSGLENLEPDLIAKKVEEKKRIYRLDLDEAQGALDGIAEGDDIDDFDKDSFPAPFQIEMEAAQMPGDCGADVGF